jgi:hypothetical protein
MNKNVKYKEIVKLCLFGDDDINTTTSSQYILAPTGLQSVAVNSGGTNYTVAATQVLILGGGGSGASAVVTAPSGAITAVTVINRGSAYSSAPNIVFRSGVTNTSSIVGGTAYSQGTTQVSFSGGGGSGATATATITANAVSAITITNPGTGYTSAPTIKITSGLTGYGAITSGGTGYADTFNVIVSGGGGDGAIVTASATEGIITALTILNPGTGYTSTPTFDFSEGGGTGANINAKIGSGATANAVIGSGAVATAGGYFTNSKRMRFVFNDSLKNVILSQNARCVVQSCNIPSLTNLAGKYVILRLVVSSQDKLWDTKKLMNGNPILLTMSTVTTVGAPNTLYNGSEFFHSINVPTNIFSQGYIDLELECPAATANIDFTTSKPLSPFFVNLVIVDEDPELTKDLTLAPPIDYKNYNVNMPIRQY